ncbi:MAG: hypothetical protein V1749_08465 [Candidatus Desantisbacteria bacterium]
MFGIIGYILLGISLLMLCFEIYKRKGIPPLQESGLLLGLIVAGFALVFNYHESLSNSKAIQQQQLQLKDMQNVLGKGNKSLLIQIKQMEVAQNQINDLQKIVTQSNSLLNSQLAQMQKTNELVHDHLIKADSIATNTEKTLKNIHHQAEILSEMLKQEQTQVESLGKQIRTNQEILSYTKSSYLFNTEEDKKRKRELIQSIINEMKGNEKLLDEISKLPTSTTILTGSTINFYFLKTYSWESIINMGWLGLFDNSQIVSKLGEYYAGILQLRYNLQLVSQQLLIVGRQ